MEHQGYTFYKPILFYCHVTLSNLTLNSAMLGKSIYIHYFEEALQPLMVICNNDWNTIALLNQYHDASMPLWQSNIFHITGPLWGESTVHQWIPLTKGQ